MMQTEEGKLTLADRKELDRNIKNLEKEIKKTTDEYINSGIYGTDPKMENKIKELRRLRRMRTQ